MTNGNDAINNSEQGPQDGLTKRELFAAMALQGCCANGIIQHYDPEQVAKYSVDYADALITALNSQPPNQ